MSISSATLQDSCLRKYFLKKIMRVAPDDDNVDDTDALRLGSAYHQVIELCQHDAKNYTTEIFEQACVEHKLGDKQRFTTYSCLTAYFKFRTKSQLRAVGCEIELGDENDGFIGYIDVVLVDKNGYWWITDLKTSGALSATVAARLPEDRQLSLYARYHSFVAAKCGLDDSKFAGVRYSSVAKSRTVVRATETMQQYAVRADTNIIEVEIPHWMLNPTDSWDWVVAARDRAMSLAASEDAWPPRHKACYEWNRPCEHWSHCHGGRTFTKSLEVVKVLDSKTVRDCTLNELPSGENYGIDLLT